MKFLSLICKFMVSLGMAMVGAFAGFVFWRIPEHVIPAGVSPILAYLMTVGVYVAVFGFEYAGYLGWKVLLKIDAEEAFSKAMVVLISRIKWAFVGMQVGIVAWLPAIYQLADNEDAPGMIVMILVILCIPVTVGVIFAIIQRLLMMAILKIEK